jgi:hypothetical protein
MRERLLVLQQVAQLLQGQHTVQQLVQPLALAQLPVQQVAQQQAQTVQMRHLPTR